MLKLLSFYKYLFVLSGIVLLAGIISLVAFGLNLGVDFKGGTITEIEFSESYNIDKIREIVSLQNFGSFQLQTTGEKGLLIKTGVIEKEQHDKMLSDIKTSAGEYQEKRFDSIGPVVGDELKRNALYQLVLVSLGIVLYIAYAFRKVAKPITPWQFGVTAVIALLHDLFVVLGIFSLLGHFYGVEVDSLFVTAMLTVLGFSVHDTIVVFDRIRENLKVYAGQSLDFVVNHSISQTMVRSLNTSLTVLFVLLALLLFGGETIKYFVLALFLGIITGTYSSIFVASPLLLLWQKWRVRKI
jgi:preprotein translocase subunit SecF